MYYVQIDRKEAKRERKFKTKFLETDLKKANRERITSFQ